MGSLQPTVWLRKMNYFYLVPDIKYEVSHALHRLERNYEYWIELNKKAMELGAWPFNFIAAHKELTKPK